MNTVPVGPSEPELADVIGSVPPLIPVPAWRLAVAGSGFAGYALAADAFDAPWQGISQLASLATGVAYVLLTVTALVSPGTQWAWLRGALATTTGLVGAAYLLLISGDLLQSWSLLEHVITPALVVVDYLAFAGGPFRGWHPFSWLGLPLAYLVFYDVGDLALYDFLNPARADYLPTVFGFVAAMLGLGFVFLVLGQARAGHADGRH